MQWKREEEEEEEEEDKWLMKMQNEASLNTHPLPPIDGISLPLIIFE